MHRPRSARTSSVAPCPAHVREACELGRPSFEPGCDHRVETDIAYKSLRRGERLTHALAMLSMTFLLAAGGCTSAGVQAQDPTTPSTTHASATPTASRTTVAPLPTPSVVPVAQDAVDSLIALYNILDISDRDPRTFTATSIQQYAEPQAVTDFAKQYQQMAQDGLAYRGQSEDPRLTVLGIESPVSILIQSCPLADPSEPLVQYTVATGKPVAASTETAAGIHRKLIRMVKTDGTWKLEQLQTDPTTACPA